MTAEYYKSLLEPRYAGRRWIIAADAAAGATRNAQRLLDAGASSVMIIGGSAGTGPPAPAGVEVYLLDTKGDSMMDGIRAFQRALDDPPAGLRSAVDEWDPDGEASVLGNFLVRYSELCGRPVYGASRPEWRALEDKMLVDDLWDAAGVERAPAVLVDPSQRAAVHMAMLGLASTDGTVLVADNEEGWHGGGEYARYLAPGADLRATVDFFERHASRIRVMPFLRGVPCSIHGLVTDDRVLAFRPVEMLVYRQEGSDEFVYAGMNTVWDPPPEVRDEMRSAVKAVGALIHTRVGYRGAFGIDGVCTDRGFFPTELNPRLTAGLGIQTPDALGYPMGDINRAVMAGEKVDLRPDQLEREVIALADEYRAGRWLRPISHIDVEDTNELPIRWDGTEWSACEERDATATMLFGPSAQGSLVFVRLEPEHGLEPGQSLARIAAASFALADELYDTRIGALVPGVA